MTPPTRKRASERDEPFHQIMLCKRAHDANLWGSNALYTAHLHLTPPRTASAGWVLPTERTKIAPYFSTTDGGALGRYLDPWGTLRRTTTRATRRPPYGASCLSSKRTEKPATQVLHLPRGVFIRHDPHGLDVLDIFLHLTHQRVPSRFAMFRRRLVPPWAPKPCGSPGFPHVLCV